MKKYFTVNILICILLASSCQRDDICASSTPTTPKLVIEFRDATEISQNKSPQELRFRPVGEEAYYYDEAIDSTTISIPLRTAVESTDYEFTINSEFDENAENDLEPNTDVIKFTYTTSEVYVSRACGYKTEFLELQATLVGEDDDQNWIDNIVVQQPNDIVDETTTHLYIYH